MRIVSSLRTRNHTGTVSGRPSGRTVVSHAIRLPCSLASTCSRRSAGRSAVRFMVGITVDLAAIVRRAPSCREGFRAWVRGGRSRGVTVAVDGFFALVWFGWGQAAAPSWLVVPLAVGTGLAALLAAAGVVATMRSTGLLPAFSDPVVRRRYGVI